jgi:release factor glutamine methyltransferase
VFSGSTDTSPNRLIPLRRAIEETASHLSDAGIASPVTDAQELLAFVLNVPRTRLLGVTGLTPQQLDRLRALYARRAQHVPLQHLTGSAPFRYLDLAVGPGVFVPRPETELLVDRGLATLSGDAIVVDLCAGSGAIALSVAREHPGSRVYAVERDPAALAWLRRNVAANTTGARVHVIEGDATDPTVLSELDGRTDLVLCNPPYVPDGTPVPPEVADHDPPAALFAGPDGLAVIRGVARRAAALLRPGGALAIEHDDTHGTAVPDLLRATGAYDRIEAHEDLAGRPRFATARRSAAADHLAD